MNAARIVAVPSAAAYVAWSTVALAAPWAAAQDAAPTAAVAPLTEQVTPVTRTAERGPVQFTVTLADDEVRVGDSVELLVEARAAAGVTVRMPTLEDEFDGVKVDGRATPPDVPAPDGWRHTTHRYELFTFAAGTHEVPGLTLRFLDGNRPGAEEQELITNPIPFDIVTTLPPDADPMTIRALKDPLAVEAPTDWIRLGVLAAIAAAACVLLAAAVWAFRRRAAAKRAAAPPPIPAHLWAREALRDLERDDLVDRGELHAFYVRLSDIVRGYLERRFNLHAPEQTTDEFLRAAERSRALGEDHRALLASFLRAADQVKFARFDPTPDEGREALGRAHAFVDETAPIGQNARAERAVA